MKTSDHQAFAEKIGQYLNEVSHSLDEESTITAFQNEYNKLLVTKPDLKSFEEIMPFIRQQLDEDKIGIIVQRKDGTGPAAHGRRQGQDGSGKRTEQGSAPRDR